jgi:hypothetical protein
MKILLHPSIIVTALFILYGASPTLATQSSQQKNPQSISDLPACYIKTVTGQIIDLTVNCGFIRPSICQDSLGSPSRDAVLADFCKRNPRCMLKNTCNEIPRGINTPPKGTPMGAIFSTTLVV